MLVPFILKGGPNLRQLVPEMLHSNHLSILNYRHRYHVQAQQEKPCFLVRTLAGVVYCNRIWRAEIRIKSGPKCIALQINLVTVTKNEENMKFTKVEKNMFPKGSKMKQQLVRLG